MGQLAEWGVGVREGEWKMQRKVRNLWLGEMGVVSKWQSVSESSKIINMV